MKGLFGAKLTIRDSDNEVPLHLSGIAHQCVLYTKNSGITCALNIVQPINGIFYF